MAERILKPTTAEEMEKFWSPERLAKAGIPLRFLGKTLEKFEATTKAQQEALIWAESFCLEWDFRPQGALLLGNPGTGKTHLAIGIVHHALLTSYVEQVFYTTVLTSLRRVKASWNAKTKDAETEDDVRSSLTYPRLLVLDEVGVQFGSTFEENFFFDILNDRYENMKPTILLSNLTQGEVSEYLGERILDRLREDGGQVIVFDWESHRGKRA
ncbi:MAG: ATP-binding protein [Sulfitobacter sp.]|nr:ATP-binding protein [Sulfitobacter sp.]